MLLTGADIIIKTLIEQGKITVNNMIVTDMQVMWKNFSTLSYSSC